jgi:hypothetical protein
VAQGRREVSAEALRPLTERQSRQIRSALEKSISFWKQIQNTLLNLGQPTADVTTTIRQMNEEVCQEFAKCPHGSKRSKHFAEVMGLSAQAIENCG